MTTANEHRPTAIRNVVYGLCAVFPAAFGAFLSWPRRGVLWDFGAFHFAGFLAARGLDPYSLSLLGENRRKYRAHLTAPNLNPPLWLPLFQVLAHFDPWSLFVGWYPLSLAIYASTVVLLIRSFRPSDPFFAVAFACAFSGLWMMLALGQVYAPLLALTAWAYWSLAQGQSAQAGVAIGMVTALKPNLVLWPTLLLCGRHRTAAVVGLLAAVTLSALPAVWFGVEVYAQWMVAARGYFSSAPAGTHASFVPLLRELSTAGIATSAAALVVVAAGFKIWRSRPDPLTTSDIALSVAILVSPVGWVGYAALLLPLFIRRPPSTKRLVAAGLLAVPANIVWQFTAKPHPIGWVLKPVYPAAMLVVAGELLLARTHAAEAAGE